MPDKPTKDPAGTPELIQVTSGELDASLQIARLVDDVRSRADGFIFLSGGASKMSDTARRELLDLMKALPILVDRGFRIAVGDGGTKAGLMEAAGHARLTARAAFPLIGVAPAPEITTTGETGRTPIDPNHSYVVAVHNPAWVQARTAEGWTPDQGYWGSEVDAMFELFNRLARDRPAVAIIANGGDVTQQEVGKHIESGRPMILVEGSGRAADALVSLLRGTTPQDAEVLRLRETAQAKRLADLPELYEIFSASHGAAALADVIARHLAQPRA